MKTIIRVNRESGNFTTIPKKLLRDKMSLRAKGLLCMVLSNVDDFVITKAWVAEHCTEGRNAVNCVFAELIELGYASAEREKDTAGRFTQQVWIFRDHSDRDGKLGTENTRSSADSQSPENT